MSTSPSWRACAIVLSILGLSGCASNPPPALCPERPPLPADLAAPLPPEGWFSQQVELILTCGRDPTSDPRCAPLLGAPTR